MRLAAMVRLVVEEMCQRGCKALADSAHVADCRIRKASGNIRALEAVDPIDDACILRYPRCPEIVQSVVDYCIKRLGRVSLAREAMQPDTVCHQ